MTVRKAREILQEEIADLTDEQVEKMIQRDSEFLDALFDVFEKQLQNERKCDNNV